MTSPALIRESEARRLAKVAKQIGVAITVKVGHFEITIAPAIQAPGEIRVDEKRRPRL
jgi:hypothetical protein